MKALVTGATFHDFEKEPVIIGVLGAAVKREKDGKGENQKAGTVMGYNFTKKNDDVIIVGNSYQITEAVKMVEEGAILRIEFKGQTQNAKGQKVNMFKIDEVESPEEWNELEPDSEETEG